MSDLTDENKTFLEEFESFFRDDNKPKEDKKNFLEEIQEAFFDVITKPLRDRPKSLNKFLKKNPDVKVSEIRICRKPVRKEISFLLNIISKGKVEKVKKKYNYDDIYHLYSILVLEDGRKFHFEKNEIVVIKQISNKQDLKHTDCVNRVVVSKNFKGLIEELESENKKLYFYSAQRHNCQAFISQIAHKLGVRDLDKFINQYGAKDIFKNKGLRQFALKITTMANAGKRLLGMD